MYQAMKRNIEYINMEFHKLGKAHADIVFIMPPAREYP
jgi:hypothetical protein